MTDGEAAEAVTFDLRWKAAAGLAVDAESYTDGSAVEEYYLPDGHICFTQGVITVQFVTERTWESPPFGAGGERIEFCRGAVNFGERRAGDETPYQGPPGPVVEFRHPVVWAEVLLSGFNMWQTRGGDSEVAQLRVDAHVESIGFGDPDDPASRRKVSLDLVYSFKDEDPTGGEDFNDAWIGFTVLAVTK